MDSELGLMVTISFDRGDALVAVMGELDVVTSGALRDQLHSLVEGDLHSGSVSIDASRVDFIDASGIGVLVGASRHAEELGRPLRIVRPSPAVRRILDILVGSVQLPVDNR